MLAGLLCLFAFVANAEERVERQEAEVKAAFLYKFLGFVQWPASSFENATSPIVVGVLGSDEVRARLQQLAPGHPVQGRQVSVRSLKGRGDSLEGMHALYVGRNDVQKPEELATHAQELSILTISDAPDGIDYGFVLNFLLDEGRVRFAASVEAAQLSKLALSSRLLSVAYRVKAVGRP
jgi:hypothetical protein